MDEAVSCQNVTSVFIGKYNNNTAAAATITYTANYNKNTTFAKFNLITLY